MNLVLNAPQLRAAVRDDLHQCVRRTFGRWLPRIRWARMSLLDVNGPKGGTDQRCTIEAYVRGLGRMVATAAAVDAAGATRAAVRRLVRRIREQYRRRRDIARTYAGGASC